MTLAFPEDGLQFGSVSGDHLFLLGRGFDDHGDFVVIAVDQCFTSFKLGDRADFRASELQHILDIMSLVLLQVQDDFVLGVVDDGPTVLTVIQAEEVAEILRSSNGSAAVSTNDLKDFEGGRNPECATRLYIA